MELPEAQGGEGDKGQVDAGLLAEAARAAPRQAPAEACHGPEGGRRGERRRHHGHEPGDERKGDRRGGEAGSRATIAPGEQADEDDGQERAEDDRGDGDEQALERGEAEHRRCRRAPGGGQLRRGAPLRGHERGEEDQRVRGEDQELEGDDGHAAPAGRDAGPGLVEDGRQPGRDGHRVVRAEVPLEPGPKAGHPVADRHDVLRRDPLRDRDGAPAERHLATADLVQERVARHEERAAEREGARLGRAVERQAVASPRRIGRVEHAHARR